MIQSERIVICFSEPPNYNKTVIPYILGIYSNHDDNNSDIGFILVNSIALKSIIKMFWSKGGLPLILL